MRSSVFLRALLIESLVPLALSSCAPALFSEEKDTALLKLKGPHSTHANCSQLNLALQAFDGTSFKETLSCFNANGNIKALVDFTDSLDQTELNRVLSVSNTLLKLAPTLPPRNFFDLLESSLLTTSQSLEIENVQSILDFMRREKISTGTSFFIFTFILFENFKLSPSDTKELAFRLLNALESDSLSPALRKLELLTHHEVYPTQTFNFEPGPILPPLIQAIALLYSKNILAEFRTIMNQAAVLMQNENFPKWMAWLNRNINLNPLPPPPAPFFNTQTPEIHQALQDKECLSNPKLQEIRTWEILDDYENSINTWELTEDRQKKPWAFKNFKKQIEPWIDKLLSSNPNSPTQPLWRALLEILNNSSENPLTWLTERSLDDRLILYFFPGTKTPKLRLINTLDGLELLLINADITPSFLGGLIQPGNNAFKFMAELASAWGDEPPEEWPELIRNQFPSPQPGKSWPPTLREAFQSMEKELKKYQSLLGKLSAPSCKSAMNTTDNSNEPSELASNSNTFDLKTRIFNIQQIMPILEENLPENQSPKATGLKKIRNLLYAILLSTPPAHRHPKAGDKNGFSILTEGAKLGMFHQAGKQMRTLFVHQPFAEILTHSEHRAELDLFSNEIHAWLNHPYFVPSILKFFKYLINNNEFVTTIQISLGRLSALKDLPELQPWTWQELTTGISPFFENQERTSVHQISQTFISFLAQRLSSQNGPSDLEEAWALLHRNSETIIQLFSDFLKNTEKGEFRDTERLLIKYLRIKSFQDRKL